MLTRTAPLAVSKRRSFQSGQGPGACRLRCLGTLAWFLAGGGSERWHEIRIDLRFAEVDHELWALAHVLEVMEPTIDRLADLYESETLAELKERGWADDEAERDLAWQETSDMGSVSV